MIVPTEKPSLNPTLAGTSISIAKIPIITFLRSGPETIPTASYTGEIPEEVPFAAGKAELRGDALPALLGALVALVCHLIFEGLGRALLARERRGV